MELPAAVFRALFPALVVFYICVQMALGGSLARGGGGGLLKWVSLWKAIFPSTPFKAASIHEANRAICSVPPACTKQMEM